MTGCLYLSTSGAKAVWSPCFTRSIRAASGSCSLAIRRNLANTDEGTRLEEIEAESGQRRSLAVEATQVRQDQFRQIIAVASFENAEKRNLQVAKGLAEPMVILGFQGFLGQRVARVGIESGGNCYQVRLELFQFCEGALKDAPVIEAGEVRRN